MYKKPNLKSIISFLKDLPKNSEEFVYQFKKSEAERYLKIIKSHIDRQDLDWIPLKPGYQKYKALKGLDPGMWLATRELYDKLQVCERLGEFYIGAPVGEVHEGSGLEVNHLIQIHEYGVVIVGIPARPLFGPSKRTLRHTGTQAFLFFSREFLGELIKNYRV